MLSTNFSGNIDRECILPEYPRPNCQRESFINLNGYWDYAITLDSSCPTDFDGRILVPFSPESELSGVKRHLKPSEYLWYRKNFHSSILEDNKRLILHFGAVDQYATVFINGQNAGSHLGGYLPFSFDITNHLVPGTNTILVRVRDLSDTSYHTRGKQKLFPGGMFYTAQSGIWQTVWMECVPDPYIKSLVITPDYDNHSVHIKIKLNQSKSHHLCEESEVNILEGDNVIAKSNLSAGQATTIPLTSMKSWSPEHPFLYNLEISYGKDKIKSYFAMRKLHTAKDSTGTLRLFLNNKPYFHNGLLDQGYWPESLYTPPSDEAMIFDITTAKNLGFNMLRKHAKIEPLRWYYHCDRLGMLVWQDMVNGGTSYHMWYVTYFPTILPKLSKKVKDNQYKLLSRSSATGRKEYIRETKATIQLLYNSPCIAMWVPFNEGWGQFDAKKVTSFIRRLDNTRTIDSTSGWFDQNTGDVRSLHIYFTPFRFHKEHRVVVLSEFGGYVLKVDDHYYSNKTYGYRIYKSADLLQKAFAKLYYNKIIPGISNGLSATVYTQLTDIEEETNGLLTYDRKVLKMNKELIQEINKSLMDTFKKLSF